MQTRILTLQGLLALGAVGCTAKVEPQEQPKSDPVDAPQPAPAPEPAREPEPTKVWQPLAEPAYVSGQPLDGTPHRHVFRNDRLHHQLGLRPRDATTTVILTDRTTGHELVQEWPKRCDPADGYTVGAELAELAEDTSGRKLLHLWVNCWIGEDIVFSETLEVFVLADAQGLSALWSGHTSKHASHVCGEWTDIEAKIELPELVITEYDRAKIYLPEEIPGYDCDESSREYDNVRASHRVKLP
jgi:hypothetical protein